VVSNLGGFSNYHAAAMVNENSSAKLRPRMDLNKRKKAGYLGNQPGNEEHFMTVKPMSKPMPDQGVDSLIQKQHFQGTPGRRIPFLNCLNVQPNILQNHIPSVLSKSRLHRVLFTENSIAYAPVNKKDIFPAPCRKITEKSPGGPSIPSL